MTRTSLREIYTERSAGFITRVRHHSRQMNILSLGRLLVIGLLIWFTVRGLRTDHWIWYFAAAVAIVIFLVLVNLFNRQKDLRNLNRELAKLNDLERECMDHRFHSLDDGARYVDPSHAWSHDLDIFGKGSLYQYMNRTATLEGSSLLAGLLTSEAEGPGEINVRQGIVQDLAPRIDFRQTFVARGALFTESEKDTDGIRSWLSSVPYITRHPWLFYLALLMTTASLALVVAALITDIGFRPFLAILLMNFMILTPFLARTNRYQQSISRKHELLEGYAALLKIIAETEFVHPELLARKEEAQKAMREVEKLSRLLNIFDQRLNMLLGGIFNGFFLFDFIMLHLLEQWKKRNQQAIIDWIGIMGWTDAFVSLAGFAFNHPSFTYPLLTGEDRPMIMEGLGHPLISPEKRVVNDMIVEDEKVVIITGANMAGKSTFLRSVGINTVLAYAGCPVCAGRFEARFTGLCSSMRTADSLRDEESYFLAEIRKLHKIVERMTGDVPLIILLDELLKGTNTTDKKKGSVGLIRRALPHPVRCFIATHDLSLGELEKELTGRVVNYCFESYIRDLELEFDYTIRKGIATNMNASFLMKKMGITD